MGSELARMEGVEWTSKWREYVGVGVVAVLGVGLLVYGLWGEIAPRETVVEIVRGDPTSPSATLGAGEVVVDVSGAVEMPGVYRLSTGSRIGDALVAAGGLAATADRAWVSTTLNLAQKIEDGGKIYIPVLNRDDPSQIANNKGSTLGKTININTASVGELDALPGIGEVRAKAIIDNRPYGSVEELKSKAKIPESVYEEIVSLVGVY